jgi:AcrR family transcriptional regulator
MASSGGRTRRADAVRSRAAVLDAAAAMLDDRPDASVEAIAAAAGVTRQTVYAHFPSREKLLYAVLDRITEEAVAAMDAAEPDAGPAADALLRMLDAAAGPPGRHGALLQRIGALPVSADEDRTRHTPVADRIEAVLRRGRRGGEFDTGLPVPWLVTGVIALAHAAGAERAAGRLTAPAARKALHESVLRLVGAAEPR